MFLLSWPSFSGAAIIWFHTDLKFQLQTSVPTLAGLHRKWVCKTILKSSQNFLEDESDLEANVARNTTQITPLVAPVETLAWLPQSLDPSAHTTKWAFVVGPRHCCRCKLCISLPRSTHPHHAEFHMVPPSVPLLSLFWECWHGCCWVVEPRSHDYTPGSKQSGDAHSWLLGKMSTRKVGSFSNVGGMIEKMLCPQNRTNYYSYLYT